MKFSMGYIDEYKARHGKCEFCKYHNVTGSHVCAECYGYSFKDSLDLVTFISKRVSEDATKKFNTSERGKQLLSDIEHYEQLYDKCKDGYSTASDTYINEELKRVDDIINSI